VGTCSSQILYEIQGPQYFGSAVVALLEVLQITQIEKDKVYVNGIKGKPPPATTKVGITAKGGWQAEFHYLLCGLDLEQNAEWTGRQIRKSIGKDAKRFSCLEFLLNGDCPSDPRNQDVATVDFRIFVQTKDRSLVVQDGIDVPGFNRWCLENFLQSCPGATIENDIQQSAGKEYFEYWVALLPQNAVSHKVNLLWNSEQVEIPVPRCASEYDVRQWSYETESPRPLDSFGPTPRGPPGWVVLGRSGDKGSRRHRVSFVGSSLVDMARWQRRLLCPPR